MPKFLLEKKVQLAIIVAITLLAYLNIFRNEFVIDDRAFILDWNEGRSLVNIGKILAGNVPAGHEGVYRPVRGLFYALYHPLFGQAPFGYHLNSLLVHLVSTILVYLIFFKITKNSWVGLVGGILFGLHPVHTEAITHIASGMDAIGTLFLLLAFYFYLWGKGLIIWSLLAAVIAYFGNEITLVLPILIILHDFCFKKLNLGNFMRRLAIYLPYIVFAIVYLMLRVFILHIGERGQYLANSPYLTFLTMLKVFVKYLGLVIWPLNLATNHIITKGIEAFVYRDYRIEAIGAQSILDLSVLLALLILAVLIVLAFALKKKYPFLTFGILWFFMALLPVAEIVPQGAVLNERHLYIASIGLIFIFACFFARILMTEYRQIALGFLIVLTSFYLYLTASRNRNWHDDVSIWSGDVASNPDDNAYAYFQLGNAYAVKGQVDLAVENYRQSLAINPHFVVAVGSIAKTYNDAGKQDLAITYYKQALLVNPNFWEAHYNLADIYTKRADFDLAADEYKRLLAIDPNFAQGRENLQSLPKLREATAAASGISDEKVWLAFHNLQGMSLKIPSSWQLSRIAGGVLIDDRKGFGINIEVDKKDPKESFEDYLAKQKQTFGELVNSGLALIPNFDKAYVKVWKLKEEERTRLQFLLFKNDKVVKVLVYPADSAQMKVFEIILGSIEI